MHVAPLTAETLARCPIAVPPLARRGDLSFDTIENAKIVRHLEAGGVKTLLYGGNAALGHVALSEYRDLLKMLLRLAGDEMVMIPSIGPNFGMAMDQAYILRDFPFPTAMWLPTRDGTTPAGVAAGVRRFVDRLGRPIVLYIKHDGYVDVPTVASMFGDGLISWIKYAVVRPNPSDDPFLADLIQAVGPSTIVSGMGEQPAIVHVRDFGLPSFTSGCVCVAPRLSAAMLRALQEGRYDDAESIREKFAPLEAIRDRVSPVRVLHEAVRLAGLADTGAICPLWSPIDDAEMRDVAETAQALLALDQEVAVEQPEPIAESPEGGLELGGLGAAAGGAAAVVASRSFDAPDEVETPDAPAEFAGFDLGADSQPIDVAEAMEMASSDQDEIAMAPPEADDVEIMVDAGDDADEIMVEPESMEPVAEPPSMETDHSLFGPEGDADWPAEGASAGIGIVAEPTEVAAESEGFALSNPLEVPDPIEVADDDDFSLAPAVETPPVEMPEVEAAGDWPSAEPQAFDIDAEMDKFLANEDVKGIAIETDFAPRNAPPAAIEPPAMIDSVDEPEMFVAEQSPESDASSWENPWPTTPSVETTEPEPIRLDDSEEPLEWNIDLEPPEANDKPEGRDPRE